MQVYFTVNTEENFGSQADAHLIRGLLQVSLYALLSQCKNMTGLC